MALRLVLLGPPGAGKGTLAEWLHQQYGLTCLSTGEIFRQEIRRKSALGRAVSRYVTSGQLVPDDLVVRVMTSRLPARLLRRGFVLDGFPRTVAQADGLTRYLTAQRGPLTAALLLRCPLAVLLTRLLGRRVCGQCGAIYHVRNMPPKRTGMCDRCNSALVVRKDDQAKTITARLRVDRAQGTPLIQYYRQRELLQEIRADGSSTQMFRRSAALFQRQGWAGAGKG